MAFCQRHQIHFISDEIYALSVFDPGEPDLVSFTSVLSIEPAIDENLLHVIYGMAKDYAAPGLRIGALITRSAALKKAFASIVRFSGPSSMSIAIAATMLEDRVWCRNLIALSQRKVADAYKFCVERLERMGVKYLHGSNAGFFVWVNLSPYLEKNGKSQQEREFELAQRLFDAGLFLQPGEEHAREPGWFRVVYTVERVIVEEGLRR